MKISSMISKIKKIGIYGVLFVVILFFLAGTTFYNVLNFWINDALSYNEWTVDIGKKGENDFVSNFFAKVQFVNLNGLARNILGQKEMNGIVKLNNGYLLTTNEYVSDEDLQQKANAIANVNAQLQKMSIPMLFAITPYTLSKYDNQLPVGVEDYQNDNMDRFLAFLEKANVDTLDFREEMHRDGIDQYDMMYRTDHHWTTKAGFYAYTKILDWMQETQDFKVDETVCNLKNYTIETYKKWHLGSRGQRTGIYFAPPDDFDLITPNFPTEIGTADQRRGTFEAMFIDKTSLENREYTSRYTYDSVLEQSLGSFVNYKAVNDKKLLIITDSMGKAVSPYLTLSVKEIKYLYLSNGSLLTNQYIEEYDPDMVIFLYYADTMKKDNPGFSFGL